MKLLADENIPLEICEKLCQEGIDVKSITLTRKGAKDKEIIALAEKEERIILTFDKDFGELVFRKGKKVKGIILLRFPPCSNDFIFNKIKNLLNMKEIEIEGKFLVVEEERVRVREFL
ncbi:DUF5615 family PIN-like protein [Candidatus Calescamantes bacterium]|nr:DUF5615 family PIN-like protein [Candidatus Calescamantes bacterium]